MQLRRDIVEKGKLRIIHILGKEQPIDMLTKQLPVVVFRKHSIALGLTSFNNQERKEVRDQSTVRSKKQQQYILITGFIADRGVLEIDSLADLKWLACISHLQR